MGCELAYIFSRFRGAVGVAADCAGSTNICSSVCRSWVQMQDLTGNCRGLNQTSRRILKPQPCRPHVHVDLANPVGPIATPRRPAAADVRRPDRPLNRPIPPVGKPRRPDPRGPVSTVPSRWVSTGTWPAPHRPTWGSGRQMRRVPRPVSPALKMRSTTNLRRARPPGDAGTPLESECGSAFPERRSRPRPLQLAVKPSVCTHDLQADEHMALNQHNSQASATSSETWRICTTAHSTRV